MRYLARRVGQLVSRCRQVNLGLWYLCTFPLFLSLCVCYSAASQVLCAR